MTGKKLTREDLTLVSDFSHAAYSYAHIIEFEDHLDSVERQIKKRTLDDAVFLAGIHDYKLFETYYQVELRLRNEDDFDRASVAMQPDGMIEQGFAFAPEGYDFRKLKHHCNKLQSIVRKTPLVGEVYIDVDREERALVVVAHNKRAYLGFRSLMSDAPVLNF